MAQILSTQAAERQLFGLVCCIPRDPQYSNLTIGTATNRDNQNIVISMAIVACCSAVSLIASGMLLLYYYVQKHQETGNSYEQALLQSSSRTYNSLHESDNFTETRFAAADLYPVDLSQISRRQLIEKIKTRCGDARKIYLFIILCDGLQACGT